MDFPAPLEPIYPTISPEAISKEILFTAFFSVYSLVKSPFIEPNNPGNFFDVLKTYEPYDKEEIIEVARKIKTYDISIKPYEDCCTVFVPEHPVIKPKLETVIEEENKCNLEESIERAYNNIEIYELSKKKKTNVFQEDDVFEI